MTRNEFLDTVNDWYELIEFCNDVGCSYCDDVYSEESMNDDINERLTDWAQECTWQELYSRLDDIPSGYDYYRCNDYGDWESLDDSDFDDYKDDVLEWMDNNGYWDEDDDDFEDEDVFDEEESTAECDEESVEDEDFSAAELIGMCSAAFAVIQQESLQRIQKEEERFNNFVNLNISKVLK